MTLTKRALWLKRLGAAALALLGLLLLLSWALPRWIESRGVEQASQMLGRPVHLESARFEPWRLGLVLNGLRIDGPAGSDAPLLSLRRLDAALSLRSIWHFSPVLASLQIEAPVLRLSRLAPGRYDIDDLIQRFGASSATPEQASSSSGVALYNIQLSEGQVLLNDVPAGGQHALSELRLDLPFISTLETDVEVHVQPLLSGRLNGVRFQNKADAQPFAKTRSAQLTLHLDELDLKPYRGYWPKALPVSLSQGLVAADLAVNFAKPEGKLPSVSVSGSIRTRDLALQQGEQALLAWQALTLQLADVQPLLRSVKLAELSWQAPVLQLRRRADGRLALPGLTDASAPASVPAAAPAAPSTDRPWRLQLDRFTLAGGQLGWRDESSKPAAELGVRDLNLKLAQLQWPLAGEASLELQALLSPPNAADAARLSAQGRLRPAGMDVDAALQGLQLAWFAPYTAALSPLKLQGLAQAEAHLAWPIGEGAGVAPSLTLKKLSLEGLKAWERADGGAAARAAPSLQWASVQLDQAEFNLGKRSASLGQLSIAGPRLALRRAADGRWNLQSWLSAGAAAPSSTTSVTPVATPATAPPPWAVKLRALQLSKGRVSLQDALAHPVDEHAAAEQGILVDELKLELAELAWPANAKSPKLPASLSLALAPLGAPAAKPAERGRLSWRGKLGLQPFALQGALRAERLPLQLLDAYLDPQLGLHLAHAELGLKAQLSLASAAEGLQAQLDGDLLLGDLRLQQARLREGQRVLGEDLLNWQALNLAGLKLALQPGQAPRVQVEQASLSDFYARLIINEEGQFNLRDLGAAERQQVAEVAAAASAAASAAAAASAPAGLGKPVISVAQTRVLNGRVDFSDRFIRPNYSAKLSDLNGALGAFSSERSEMAELNLKGRVAGTGLLDISGRINPGVSPPTMDLKASATDIELAPLSPYAGKYAGYAIERGKLSTRLQYRIEPGGALQAENQVILNQLTFGERIDSPDATKLPVLLAVALLKDRHGVIDVNLPISGSINDPQFSVGGLVFKLILNLLGKALTAPFSLLAGGGGPDLSQVEFVPGAPRLAEAAAPALDKLARALLDRPQLNLTVTAYANPATESQAMQQLHVEQLLVQERRRELQRQQTAQAQADAESGSISLSEAERQRLLKQVYGAAKLPGKPRNVIGLAKDIPPAEMRALLAADHKVTPELLRQLALERGVAVRDALIARGVPNERLFVASPKLVAADEKAEAGAEAKSWLPHADLTLAAQ